MSLLSSEKLNSLSQNCPFLKKIFCGKKGASQLKPIVFSTDKKGVFVVLSTIGLLLVAAAIPFSVALLSHNQDLRTAASGTFWGDKIFCQGGNLCPDGRCEGDTWYDCNGCPAGKARLVTQIICDQYKKSQCYYECQR